MHMTLLCDWWNRFSSIGPTFGYHANDSKTWPLTKNQHLANANPLFSDTEKLHMADHI